MYFYAVLANFFKIGHSLPLYIPPLLLPQSHHRHCHSSRLTPISPQPQPPILRIFHLRLPLLSRKSLLSCVNGVSLSSFIILLRYFLYVYFCSSLPHFFPFFLFNLHLCMSFICVLSFCIPYSSMYMKLQFIKQIG